MARRVSLALAIIAGIAAALLSSTSPGVQLDGQTRTCTALLVAFEVGSGTTTQELYPGPPSTGDPEWADHQLARACDHKEQRWAWLAGLSALVCVVAGSGARFAGRGDDEEALTDDRTHESVQGMAHHRTLAPRRARPCRGVCRMRHACSMGKPDEWERLIQQLDTWTSASEIAPGRIEVSVPHEAGRRQVVVVMTADEWDDMVGVMWGSFDSALKEVKAALSQLRPDDAFAVYSQYRLCPSAEATLPVSPVPMPEPSGTWVVHDHDGRVESRFAD